MARVLKARENQSQPFRLGPFVLALSRVVLFLVSKLLYLKRNIIAPCQTL